MHNPDRYRLTPAERQTYHKWAVRVSVSYVVVLLLCVGAAAIVLRSAGHEATTPVTTPTIGAATRVN
jgi:hypothetical protein